MQLRRLSVHSSALALLLASQLFVVALLRHNEHRRAMADCNQHKYMLPFDIFHM